jgi:hypothetical protein
MKIDSPLPTYIGYEVGYFTDTDLVDWAVQYLPTSEYFSDDPDLVELASINEKNKFEVEKAGDHLRAFVKKQWPDYSLKNNKAEIYAKKYLKSRLREYLAGQCSPYEVCRMVTPIEQVFDFPKWLGNMYNACDWIEPNTSRADCKHLDSEIEKTIGL